MTSRLPQIDSLRAVACGVVLFSHGYYFVKFTSSDYLGPILNRYVNFGWLGVFLFFGISGFVTPSTLKDKGWLGAKKFIIKRFWKLYPIYWIAALSIIIFDSGKYSITHLLWRMTMLPVENRSALGISGYFWTLQVELIFYLLLIISLAFPIKLNLKNLLYILVIYFSIYGFWFHNYQARLAPLEKFSAGLPFSVFTMIWGASYREAIKENIKSKDRAKFIIHISLISGIFATFPIHSIYFGIREWSMSLLQDGLITLSGVFLFLFWVILKPKKFPALSRIGIKTYSIYLFHGTVILLLSYAISKLEMEGLPLIVYIAVYLALSFSLGTILYHFLEKRFNSIGVIINNKSVTHTKLNSLIFGHLKNLNANKE